MVVEADANEDSPYGTISTTDWDVGSPADVFPLGAAQTITDNGFPNLQIGANQYSHLAVRNITYGAGTRTVHIDSLETQRGLNVIEQNTTWSGTVQVNRDVLVADGATLTIAAGSEVIVGKDGVDLVSIRVEPGATLTAVGTKSQPVTFRSGQSIPTKHDWSGIQGNVGSTLTWSNCTLKHASMIEVYGNNHSLSDLTLDSCDSGLRIVGDHNRLVRSSFVQAQSANMVLIGNDNEVRECNFSQKNSLIQAGDTSTVIASCTFSSSSGLSIQGNALIENNVFSEGWLEITGSPAVRHNVMLGAPSRRASMMSSRLPSRVQSSAMYCWYSG